MMEDLKIIFTKLENKLSEEKKAYEDETNKKIKDKTDILLDDYENKKSKIEASLNQEKTIINKRLESSILNINKLNDLEIYKKLIDISFEKAKEKIKNLNEVDYINFLTNVIVKTLDKEKGFKLILNKEDRKKYGDKLIVSVLKSNGAKSVLLAIAKGGSVISLSSEVADIKDGFILEKDSVKIKCTLDDILGDEKEELEKQIVEILKG